jgi:hypothetical protein
MYKHTPGYGMIANHHCKWSKVIEIEILKRNMTDF